MAPRLLSCFGRRSSPAATTDPAADPAAAGPVLVELFSSQGCAMSPEADAVASRLAAGDLHAISGDETSPQVVVLGFHVDYWDYRGWKDPFGSSMWTVRQKAYVEALRLDTLFTPQAVVHGRAHAVGTEQEGLAAAVRAAPQYPSPTMQVTFQRPSPNMLQASFTGALCSKVDSTGADVLVALYENGLVTNCAKGENKGKVLPNDQVVRCLEKLLSVKDVPAKKKLSGSVQFALWNDFNPAKCGIVLFVQNRALQVFGVQKFQLPGTI